MEKQQRPVTNYTRALEALQTYDSIKDRVRSRMFDDVRHAALEAIRHHISDKLLVTIANKDEFQPVDVRIHELVSESINIFFPPSSIPASCP